RELHHWKGIDRRGGFGGVVAAVADLDGDGKGEIVVAAPGTEDQTRTLPGELHIYSGATGKKLRHWSGSQPGEEFARMVVGAGDLDGDGIEDLAIGAPWHRRETADRVGRVELRSGRSGKVLAELLGDEADCWFGWHIRRAPDPDGRGRPALLISSLRHPVDGKVAVGVLDLYVLRPAEGAGDHGTITRGARRSDIK
ncbi:MAG: FG-GAP repeat domain-containing protein, partial [Candidatus Binatia bacterium]